MKILSLFLTLCLLFTACGVSTTPTAEAVTFTDDLGRTVAVEQPQRVAALLGSFAQIWMLAGGEVCATADDAWDDLALNLSADTVNLGGTKALNLELLLAARPDFILASANTRQNLEWQDTLEATGIPVAYFDVSDFDDYLRLLKLCTDITERPDLYETHGTAVQAQIDAVLAQSRQRLEQSEPPTVLCMRASASSITVKNSKDNVLGEMLHSLGCVNIADSDESLLENLSFEQILLQDPDHIFFVQLGDDIGGTKANIESFFAENPGWQELKAVKSGNVHYLDKRLYNLKPNALWAEAYEGLEEILCENQD